MQSTISKNQLAAEQHLPAYDYHVSDSIVALADERIMFTARLKGMPFEVIDDQILERNYDSLNNLFLSIAKSTGSRLAIWAHLDHYQTSYSEKYEFTSEWLKGFSQAYLDKIKQRDTFENYFYLTFVLKPSTLDILDEAIKELTEIQANVKQLLRAYECEILETYEHEGYQFSEVYEFLAYLYNGFWERVPVTALPMAQVLPSSTLHFGYKLLETRFPDAGRRYSALSDLKDFPDTTSRGKFNPMLDLPFPFLLCFSFTFISPANSIAMINQINNKLTSAGDEADDQYDENTIAKGAISSGQVYFGEFHGALVVYGNSEKQVEDRSGTARTTLSGYCGTLFVTAATTAPETFFSLFPANVKRRPRPMPKTTRNLVGLFSMNTFSSGKQFGNPLGDGSAILPLQTRANGIYHFNFHYSLPNQDFQGKLVPGHFLMLGATGVGKTTAQCTMVAFTERFNSKIFAIDKEGSMRGLIEALGGTYFTLNNGVPTGLNPFQLPVTPQNREFLYDLVGACGRRLNQDLKAEDNADIKQAVDTVLQMQFEFRRFGVLLQNIPDRGEDSLKRRLAEWCYGDEGESDGRFAYALDNPTNLFDWTNFKRVGFDVNDFLVKGHPATEPILSYLLHLKTLMKKDGELMVTIVEEFWLPIMYPTTAAQIQDVLKTGRRRMEYIGLVSQSPAEAINTPLLPDILEQTATKIFLPNPKATYDPPSGKGYMALGLSIKEFEMLYKLDDFSRMFLIKQGNQSSIAKLDLAGLEDDIAVMAMAKSDFQYLDKAKAQVGKNPDDWIPVYKQLRRDGLKQAILIKPSVFEKVG